MKSGYIVNPFSNSNGYSYWIPEDSHKILITFGSTDDECKDITLNKQNYSTGYCEQFCFNYNNKKFALCDKYHFNIKRIIVYQLI